LCSELFAHSLLVGLMDFLLPLLLSLLHAFEVIASLPVCLGAPLLLGDALRLLLLLLLTAYLLGVNCLLALGLRGVL
jgi:hypothetical protein